MNTIDTPQRAQIDLTMNHPTGFDSTQIGLVLFDIDGTLRNSRGDIPDSLMKAIATLRTHQANAQPLRFGIASGRSFYGAAEYIRAIAADGPSILCAGGLVVRPDGSVLYQQSVERGATEQLIQECRKYGLGLELNLKDCCYIDERTPLLDIHHSYHPQGSQRVRDLLEALHSEDVLKLSLIIDAQQFELHYPTLVAAFPEFRFLPAHGAAHPELYFINVQSTLVSIADALQAVLQETKLHSDQLISFGDGESDIPLMQRLMWSVAMGNANDKVKNAASMLTKHVDDDGAAFALRSLFRELHS